MLLIPIGFGAILANLPLADMSSHGQGIIALIYNSGIKTELLPPIIFMGVGVLTDFRPLLGRPLTFLLGAAAQLGIFAAALGAAWFLGFTPKEAAAIGIPDDMKGNVIHAHVILRAGIQGSPELVKELMDHVGHKVGPIAKPAHIEFVESLPKTRSGKIMRRLLKARAMGLPEGDTSTLEG